MVVCFCGTVIIMISKQPVLASSAECYVCYKCQREKKKKDRREEEKEKRVCEVNAGGGNLAMDS